MGVASDIVQLALDAKTLGCGNHSPKLDLLHPTEGGVGFEIVLGCEVVRKIYATQPKTG